MHWLSVFVVATIIVPVAHCGCNFVVIIARTACADSAAPSVSHLKSKKKNGKIRAPSEKNRIKYGTKKLDFLGCSTLAQFALWSKC